VAFLGRRIAVKLHPRMVIARADEPDERAVVLKLITQSAHAVKVTHVGMDPFDPALGSSMSSRCARAGSSASV
jgi:hypothetical protein